MVEDSYFLNEVDCRGAEILTEILNAKSLERTASVNHLLANLRLDPHVTQSRVSDLDNYYKDNFKRLAGLSLERFMIESSDHLFPSRFDEKKNATNMISRSGKSPVGFTEGSELLFVCRFSELCKSINGLQNEACERTISALNKINESYSKDLKFFDDFDDLKLKSGQYMAKLFSTLKANARKVSEHKQHYLTDFLVTFLEYTNSERADERYPTIYWRTPKAPTNHRFVHAENIIKRLKCSLSKGFGENEIYFVVFLDAESCKEQLWYPTAIDMYNRCGLISYPGYVSRVQATDQYELTKNFGAPSDLHICRSNQKMGSFGVDYHNYSLLITDSLPSVNYIKRTEMISAKQVPQASCQQINASCTNSRIDYHSVKKHLHPNSRKAFNSLWGDDQQTIFYLNR